MKSFVVVIAILVSIEAGFPAVSSLFGYHGKIGIPTAARIKSVEDEIHARSDGNSRIIGGVLAPQNAHPYMGGLVISFANLEGLSSCGSTLVSANRLVTAAHCWFDGYYQANQYVVVLGSLFLFSGGTRISTSHVVMHPQWNPNTLANDIAIIYLPVNVLFSAAIIPVTLPSGNLLSDNFAGRWAMAAGYGMTSSQQTGVPINTQLRHVNVQVITTWQCQAFFGPWALSSNICTSGAGIVGLCGGDSGGPLVVFQNGQHILVGVSSFIGWGGCEAGEPSAYARVTSFNSFIRQHL